MQQSPAHSPTGAIEAYLPFLRRHARALMQDQEAADALVRDCLERAMSRVDGARRGTDLRVGLLRLLHLEHARRSPEARRSGTWRRGHGGEPAELQLFRSAFDRLPAEDRKILLLTGLEGLTAEESSKVLGIDAATARTRAVRARERLCLLQCETGAFPAGLAACDPNRAVGSAA